MSERPERLSEQQMTKLAEALTAAGWEVDLEIEDETEVPCVWDETAGEIVCPKVCSIGWGSWAIADTGELIMDSESFPINDCDLTGFIKDAHRAWHAVGGPTIRATGQAS